jgi:hypothetical protein
MPESATMLLSSIPCRCCQVAVVVVAGLLIVVPGSAVTPLALYRSVETTAGANVNSHAPPDSELSYTSSALGIFDETREAIVVASGMGDVAQGTATAMQQSEVQSNLVQAAGETHVSLSLNTGSGGGAFGDAVAELVYDFSLDIAMDYEVAAEVDHFGPVSDASVQLLLEDATTIFAIGEPTNYTANSLAQTGTLSPGNYKLIGSADTILSYLGPSFPTTSGAEFTILFSMALPGDFDFDGDVDGRDFLVWQRNPSVGDLADWQSNYGVGSLTTSVANYPAATASSEIGASPVPEPGTSVLMAGLLFLNCYVRRTRTDETTS